VAVPSLGVVPDINFGLAIGVPSEVLWLTRTVNQSQICGFTSWITRQADGESIQSDANGEYEMKGYLRERIVWGLTPTKAIMQGSIITVRMTGIRPRLLWLMRAVSWKVSIFKLALGGSISGIVTDPNGQPAAYIVVNTVAYPDGSYGFSGRTDPNGMYEIWGLPPGYTECWYGWTIRFMRRSFMMIKSPLTRRRR